MAGSLWKCECNLSGANYRRGNPARVQGVFRVFFRSRGLLAGRAFVALLCTFARVFLKARGLAKRKRSV